MLATLEVDAAQLTMNACMVPTVERVAERRVRCTSQTAYDMIRTVKAACTLIFNAVERNYG